MIYKYLPIALLLAMNTATANTTLPVTNEATTEASASIAGSESNYTYSPALAASLLPSRYSGGSGVFARPFYDIDLGYAGASGKVPGLTFGGSFMFAASIGAKIFIPSSAGSSANVISISVGGTEYSVKEKYKDGNGDMRTDGLQFGVAQLPLSFMHINYGRYEGGVGYFWTLGVNVDYISSVKNGDRPVTNQFNTVYFEPMISAGFTTRFVLRNVRTHRDVGSGRLTAGPFFTYIASNLAKDAGYTLNGYRTGIRWTYIW
jgi:hypothetical protein